VVKVELHPEAEVELYEAAAWYDDERPGLGDDFVVEMTRWLDVIAEGPSTWPKWPDAQELDPPIRKALSNKFPYAIAYQAQSNHVWVLAFAHTSRRPFYWAKRAKP
jgi:hypothetical protein